MTLSANSPLAFELGERNDYTLPASTQIYEGAAVGIVAGTGLARSLVAGDRFAGFAEQRVDSTAGADSRWAGTAVRVVDEGEVPLAVTGVTIADVRQPVYASDENTFQMSPVGGSFIGFVKRYVASGVAVVEFDADELRDPYGEYTVRETISNDKTLDIQDNGKLFWVDTDAKVITMPAVATPVNCKIVNGGAFGTVLVAISPNASDKVQGPDLPGTDDHDLLNTKATARRGDFAKMITGDANGPIVSELCGIWATA